MRSIQTALLLTMMSSAAAGQTAWERPSRQGEALEREGRYEAAASAFEAALPEAERLGPEDWRLPLTLHNLGAVTRELGKYPKSDRYYRRAISIWESKHPDRLLELAASLHNLAALNLVLGRLGRAEPLYRRALELREKGAGAQHPLTAATLHGLAEVAAERRRYDEADNLYHRAAAILEAAYGPFSLKLADVWHNQAILYRDLRREADARQLLEHAAAAYEKTAPGHPNLAIILRNLAELYAAGGEAARADQFFTRSLRICEASLPPDHPQTGIILQSYEKFLYRTKRKKEAEAVAARARSTLLRGARENGTVYTVDVSAFSPK